METTKNIFSETSKLGKELSIILLWNKFGCIAQHFVVKTLAGQYLNLAANKFHIFI